MKITIDTKEDSHEEIKKIISMLSSLVGKDESEVLTNDSNAFENSHSNENSESPNTDANLFNMFGSDVSSESQESPTNKPDESNSGSDSDNVENSDSETTEIKIEPREDTSKKESDSVDLGIPQLEEYED